MYESIEQAIQCCKATEWSGDIRQNFTTLKKAAMRVTEEVERQDEDLLWYTKAIDVLLPIRWHLNEMLCHFEAGTKPSAQALLAARASTVVANEQLSGNRDD